MRKHKDKIELIWKAFAKGKKWAFSEIYNQSYDDLYRFGVKFIKDDEQVKDIIHDLYYKLWQNRENLSTPRNLRSYLISSLRSTIINHLKKDKKGIVIFDPPEEAFSLESSIESDIISDESRIINNKALYEGLNTLSSKQKEAIYLHYIQEMDYKEIATIMEISLPYTRNLVHQGIKKLKESRNKFVR